MAESEPVNHQPEPDPPATGSWVTLPPFDIAAVEGTSAYPLNHTLSFADTPDAALATATGTPGGDSSVATASPNLPVIPGYRILGVLGGGGMGTVFKALHLALNKVVALKLINAGWANDNDFRARFAREATTLAALEHPNIVPVYDAGNWQGLPYLTMKFVPGQTLYHHMTPLRRDPRAAARLLIQVARAVHYLHSKGIVHRDLKPLNILLTEDGTPLVADFGLVLPVDGQSDFELSVSLVPLGTRQYMSPEQTLGGRENYTFACDIWALGIILYELLSGHRPFGHEDPAELIRQIRNDPVPAIPADRNAPQGLEAIARKCLQKSVAERYATAEEVAADLERWLAGEVIPLPPDLPPVVAGPTRRPPASRKYRWAIAAVMLALLGFSGLPPLTRQDDTPRPPRPTLERMNAGETVWLVGPKGSANVPTRTLPGGHGIPTTEVEGYLTLTSAGMLVVEFETGPLPDSFRFEGEAALVATNDNWSWGGIFGGHKETPGQDGPHHTAVQLVQQNAHRVQENQEAVTEKATIELHRWVAGGSRGRTERASKSRTVLVPLDRTQELSWQPFALVIAPGEVTGSWRDQRVGSFAADPTLKLLNNTFRMDNPKSPPPFQTPVFGPGLGLCVNNATAVFRNVRLIPVVP